MMTGVISNRHGNCENASIPNVIMANQQQNANAVDVHRGVGIYFRGNVSNGDSRQLIFGAAICNNPDSSGKRLRYFGCSINGETIVDYQVERSNNFIANQIDKLPCVLPEIFGLLRCESEQYAELIGQKVITDMLAGK